MDHKPDIDQLQRTRPDLAGLEFLGEGGFKTVYKAESQETAGPDIEVNLRKLSDQVGRSTAAYSNLQTRGISEGIETVMEYLEQLSGSVDTFKRLAEL